MKAFKIRDLLQTVITGEWGDEPVEGEGTPILRTTNFTNDGEINYSNVVVRTISPKIILQKRLIAGDIIIEKSGGSPTQPVGRVVFFDKNEETPYLCNNFTTVLRPNKNLVSPKFLFYILHQNHLIGNTAKFQNKTTGIINLKLEAYLNESITIPTSIHLQAAYTQILDKAKSIFLHRQKSIDTIDNLIRAIFLDMFGDVSENPKKWKTSTLDSIAKISSGGTPSRTNKKNFEGDIFWVKTGEVKGERIYSTKEKITELGLKNSNCLIFPPKTILVAMYGQGKTRGQVGILEVSAATNQACATISVNQGVNADYLYYFLRNSYTNLRNLGRGGNQLNLNLSILKEFKVFLPDLNKQNQFSSIVLKAEVIRDSIILNLNQHESFFQSLIIQAFNGVLELHPKFAIKGESATILENVKSNDVVDAALQNQEYKNNETEKLKNKLITENVTVAKAEQQIKSRFKGMSFSADDVINYLIRELGWVNINYDVFSNVIFKWLDDGELRQYLFDPEIHGDKRLASIDDDPMEESKSIEGTTRKILLELV